MELSGPHAGTQVAHSQHLAGLLVEVDHLAERVRTAPEARRVELGCERTQAATLATLRLDGSRLEALPDLEDVGGRTLTAPAPADRGGTWLDAMRALDEPADEQLEALEALGARAGLGSDDLATGLLADTTSALEELHRRLTLGLVADDRAGRPRQVAQAVHDASTGRVLYFTADPATIPRQLARLSAWMAENGRRAGPLVASGLLHLELLRIHPFDAANGRLARTAARLVLRAGARDPDGLACPEPELAADPLGYHEEVAGSARRRDPTIWLERWAEAVAAGLRASATDLDVLDVVAPDRAERFLSSRDEQPFTLADYRDHVAATTAESHHELRLLVDAGRIRRVPGSRGLRFLPLA